MSDEPRDVYDATQEELDHLRSEVWELNHHLDSIMHFALIDTAFANRYEQVRWLIEKVGNLAIRAAAK